MFNICLIEDMQAFHTILEKTLNNPDINIISYKTGERFLEDLYDIKDSVKLFVLDFVLLDIDISFVEILEKIVLATKCKIPILIWSSMPEENIKRELNKFQKNFQYYNVKTIVQIIPKNEFTLIKETINEILGYTLKELIC